MLTEKFSALLCMSNLPGWGEQGCVYKAVRSGSEIGFQPFSADSDVALRSIVRGRAEFGNGMFSIGSVFFCRLWP